MYDECFDKHFTPESLCDYKQVKKKLPQMTKAASFLLRMIIYELALNSFTAWINSGRTFCTSPNIP
jgi:hypothetical protein